MYNKRIINCCDVMKNHIHEQAKLRLSTMALLERLRARVINLTFKRCRGRNSDEVVRRFNVMVKNWLAKYGEKLEGDDIVDMEKWWKKWRENLHAYGVVGAQELDNIWRREWRAYRNDNKITNNVDAGRPPKRHAGRR